MRKRPFMFMCLIFLIIRSIIILINGGQESWKLPASSIFQDMNGEREILIRGQVYKKTNTSKVQILYLKNNSIYSQNHSFYESRILIYDDTFQEIEIGKTVTVKGVVSAFQEARNPGNFDQKLYYAKQNIYGSVWSEQVREITGKEAVLREKLYQIKVRWKRKILEAAGEKNGAVLSAMLLSEKGEMDTEIKELYQKSGIGHILAISGLHISFIGLGIYKCMRKAGCPYWLAGIGSVFLLSTYAAMVGISVSVLRAYIMLLLRIGADLTGRVYDMATSLSLAGVITMIWQPLSLYDAGFLMSYGAILGILLIVPMIKKMFPCRYRLLGGFYASIGINLMLFPVLLSFYFEFPVYSLFLNMAVIPLMSIVLGLGIFGSVCLFIWEPSGVWMLKGCGAILEFFEYLSRFSSTLPVSRVVFGKPSLWQIVIYYAVLGGLLLLFYHGQRVSKQDSQYRRRKRLCRIRQIFCLMVVGMIPLFLVGHGKYAGLAGQEMVSVTVLDVGQGDGIFMRGPDGGTYLIDGGSSDVEEVGKYRLEPFLKSQGVGELDYVFLSHGDSDHYSGVEEMILRKEMGVKIRHLVLPATYKTDKELCQMAAFARKNGVDTVVMEGGQILAEGEMVISCLYPCSLDKNLEGNAGSMVLDIQFREFDMVCTGDVEGTGEEMLAEKLEKKYDVLKVAHHGSKHSTGQEFLEKVKPKIAVISAGEKNRYGHPHRETMERLEGCGCEIYNTIQNGAVMIQSDGKALWVDGFR